MHAHDGRVPRPEGRTASGQAQLISNAQHGLHESEREELYRLRRENSELRMQRDVLKRSVVLWVDEATGRKR